MRDVFEKIHELQAIPSYSKNDQLVKGVINAIDEKLLTRGSALPSVNVMIKEFGFARETIVKAYRELKERGIIESHNRLRYYVANEDTSQEMKVALLMFTYDTFQKVFFNSFRETLGEHVHLDVFFHHSNIEIFETILNHVKGRYSMYAISAMPHPKTAALLHQIPSHKLVMFDRLDPMSGGHSTITQEFEISSYQAFCASAEAIQKYDEFIFFYQPTSDIPIEILRSFTKFTKEYNIKSDIQTSYKSGSVEKGKAYLIIDNVELFAVIKDCKSKGLVIGRDVGLLSHNDEPGKELIADGISTFSTDFALMGKRTAQIVLSKERVQEIIPSTLIRRNSL
jgi:DNA-binding transcriptional regulator YhcF (GntR family)